MKKKLFCLIAVIGVMFVTTSCNDDDNSGNAGSTFEAKVYSSSENNLTVNLNGVAMLGKQAAFSPAANGTAGITLSGETLPLDEIIGGVMSKADTQPVTGIPTTGVIPGSPSMSLDVKLIGDESKCTFEGSGQTDYCNYSYSGAVDANSLAITFKDVKLKDLTIAGTWTVPVLDNNFYNLIRVRWESERGLDLSGSGEELPIGDLVSMLFIMPMFEPEDEDGNPTMTIADMLEMTLKTVTFGEDGFITARYADSENGFSLTDSPKGVAQYVVTDAGTIRVYLNPANIIAATQRLASKSRSFDPDALIESLMTNVVPMLASGVPVHFSAAIDSEGKEDVSKTSFYLGTETILPILKILAPLFEDEEIVSYIVGMIAGEPEMADMAPMIEAALNGVPDVINTTNVIEIGINLEKAQ